MRILKKAKFDFIRKCHLHWYNYTFQKIALQKRLVPFTCNLCESKTEAQLVNICSREKPSCQQCGSNLRMRSVIHLLSTNLFGKSLTLPNFPKDKNIVGLGMSDREEYAGILAEKFSYSNTYYHKEPKFDITSIVEEQQNKFDFVISCDVLEHVAPPTFKAFNNLKLLLKNSGLVISTVPYMLFEKTWEHFPELNDYEIVTVNDKKTLINITQTGKRQSFPDLSFHGGHGATLELRIFTKSSLLKNFETAGFRDIQFHRCHAPNFGIIWPINWSLPITSRY